MLLRIGPTHVRPYPVGASTGPVICPPADDHYIVERPSEAYRRVMWSNPSKTSRSTSIVGPTGHLERANAWTHMVGAALFALYGLVRIAFIDTHSVASQLSGIAIMLTAATFLISTVYHVYGTVPGCAAFVRNLDHVSIYLSMSFAGVADVALVSNDFVRTPLQVPTDALVSATCLGVYFSVRRYFVPREETREFMFTEACSLGLFRMQHSDLEHAGLRIVGVGALTLMWILLVPAAFSTLPSGMAVLYLASRILAAALLASGIVLDNLYLPDRSFVERPFDFLKPLACQSKRYGCVCTSHSWWHVLSILGAAVITASRELAVQSMAVHAG